jgi:hypothetical protein
MEAVEDKKEESAPDEITGEIVEVTAIDGEEATSGKGPETA